MDLDRPILIDMVLGNSAADLRAWCARQDPEWLAGIDAVATDLAESYRAGLDPIWPARPGWRTPSMW